MMPWRQPGATLSRRSNNAREPMERGCRERLAKEVCSFPRAAPSAACSYCAEDTELMRERA